ncbi:aminotransferase class III-fold pyridoxal phosphate-dependent enzyme [Robbsia andropogonis]|uniref:aminotransferase class III-fold pyridoxal phosphate-dependent enzyme n=1 Tax=Robbsia andropogonis TaxID=28092 RepID=UPI000467320B|nr:aminotransferase class III-fold pyridoxal phosphate-dependent enzyme [Robbsia andropogonis]
MNWSQKQDLDLRERAQAVIPGGMYGHMHTALLPKEYPQYIRQGKGCHIWDYDGHEYIDYMCGYGPNLLGYGHATVESAVQAQLVEGDVLTGPSAVMIEAAETFVSMVSHAAWAMFCKNGTDATTMAMVMARAHTGREIILAARDAYHGAAPWCVPPLFSTGTLPQDRASIVYYDYNDPESLTDAFKAHDGKIAAVFAAPFRHDTFRDQEEPDAEYAKAARRLCDENGALLVIDDVRAGFRLARDCSWSTVGVEPDLSCWGKCIANGHPISAVLGREHVRAAASRIFVTGSFWFAGAPMAAAVATLKIIRDTDYLERIIAAGQALRTGLHEQALSHGFILKQTGPVQMPQILFEDDADFSKGYAWVTECIKRGVYLHPYHNMFLSTAHTPQDITKTLASTDEAFEVLAKMQHLDAIPPAYPLAPLFEKYMASLTAE